MQRCDRFYHIKAVAIYISYFGGYNFPYRYQEFKANVSQMVKSAINHTEWTIDYIIARHIILQGKEKVVARYDGKAKPTTQYPFLNGVNRQVMSKANEENIDRDKETAQQQENWVAQRLDMMTRPVMEIQKENVSFSPEAPQPGPSKMG